MLGDHLTGRCTFNLGEQQRLAAVFELSFLSVKLFWRRFCDQLIDSTLAEMRPLTIDEY